MPSDEIDRYLRVYEHELEGLVNVIQNHDVNRKPGFWEVVKKISDALFRKWEALNGFVQLGITAIPVGSALGIWLTEEWRVLGQLSWYTFAIGGLFIGGTVMLYGKKLAEELMSDPSNEGGFNLYIYRKKRPHEYNVLRKLALEKNYPSTIHSQIREKLNQATSAISEVNRKDAEMELHIKRLEEKERLLDWYEERVEDLEGLYEEYQELIHNNTAYSESIRYILSVLDSYKENMWSITINAFDIRNLDLKVAYSVYRKRDECFELVSCRGWPEPYFEKRLATSSFQGVDEEFQSIHFRMKNDNENILAFRFFIQDGSCWICQLHIDENTKYLLDNSEYTTMKLDAIGDFMMLTCEVDAILNELLLFKDT
ncbi:hypothetical protein [Shouchella shacheensis]|uniref:hypothetical protein n=1 Tax=Shouchella shacheensis TaxID=1649580 RepID=UPI0007404124|nr:hypothetical protein [Shouchella shacheensis]